MPNPFEQSRQGEEQEQLQKVEARSITEKAVGEFDALKELTEFRIARHNMTRQEQKERLKEIKTQLMVQWQGMAKLVEDLRLKIEKNPDASFSEFSGTLEEGCFKALRLTLDQERLFYDGIGFYVKARKDVKKYRELYPKDHDLFKALFNTEPKGKIEVEMGSATLFFKCFNKRDYAMAREYWKIVGDESRLEPEAVRIANLSAGSALKKVAIDELNHAIILENVSVNNPRALLKERVLEDKSLEVGKWEEISIDEIGEAVTIAFSGKNIFEIRVTQRDAHTDLPLRLTCTSSRTPGVAIFDVMRVAPLATDRPGSLADIHSPQRQLMRQVAGTLGAKARLFGEFIVSNNTLKLRAVEYDATMFWDQIAIQPVPNREYSEKARIHEEQHIFNRFFTPMELDKSIKSIMMEVASGVKSPENAEEDLIKAALRVERADMGVDSNARDEILAYYKEDTPFNRIGNILTQSELYNPFRVYKSSIQELPETIYKDFVVGQYSRHFKAFYELIREKTGGAVEGKAISPKDIQDLILAVFRDEYNRDIRRWLQSVADIEGKGYNRDEVLSALYTAPVSEWAVLARRLSPKQRV